MPKLATLAALPLILAGAALACPLHAATLRGPVVMADNAATSTPTPPAGDPTKRTDSVAFPNSPNGSPAASDKGAPVVTDRAACTGGTGATATCADSPRPSGKADTSDVRIATPTTVDGTAPKN